MAAETETKLPESIDVHQMADLLQKEETAEKSAEEETVDPEHAAEAAELAAAAKERDVPAEEAPEGEHQETEESTIVDAPEFWAAEDKAAWAKVPAELKPVLQKYEAARNEHVKAKEREAAAARNTAAAEAKAALEKVDQSAKWWQQAGPAFHKAFGDKWAQVDWGRLAAENPAEWARLNQIRADEHALLMEAERKGRADLEEHNRRKAVEEQEFRKSEHAKVATKYPSFFGTVEKAQKTYDELGKYLFSYGIPADRINEIHEAPIIEIALKAMRFDQAQKRASAATSSGATANNTANVAPKRVVPGPASTPVANRVSNEALRQAKQRFHENPNDMEAAAAYARAAGL